jgi:hypothetical protein
VKLAQAAGWQVCVIATPAAMHWIDPTMLAELVARRSSPMPGGGAGGRGRPP